MTGSSYTGNWQVMRKTTISAPQYVSGYQTPAQNPFQNPRQSPVQTTGQNPRRTVIHTSGQTNRQSNGQSGQGLGQTAALTGSQTTGVRYAQQVISRQTSASSPSYSCFALGCHYRCRIGANGQVQCTCPPGYMLGSDQRSCVGEYSKKLWAWARGCQKCVIPIGPIQVKLCATCSV